MTDPVTLTNEYGDKMNQAAQEAKSEAKQLTSDFQSSIQNLPNTIQEGFQSVIKALTTFDRPVTTGSTPVLTKCYFWASVCSLGCTVGEIAGMNIFHSVMTGIFGGWMSILMVIVLPLMIWLVGRMMATPNENSEQILLAISVVFGILLGSMVAKCRLAFFACPVQLLPLSVALAGYAIGDSQAIMNHRGLFVGAMLGAGAVLMVFYSMMSSQNAGSMMTYAIILILGAVIDLQVKLDHAEQTFFLQVEQWQTVVVLALADFMAFWMMAQCGS